MHMRRFTLGLFLCWLVSTTFAGNIDSLRIALDYQTDDKERLQSLYAISYSYLTTGDTAGLSFWEDGKRLAKKMGEDQLIANFLYLKAYFERGFRDNHTDAYVHLTLAKELYSDLNEIKSVANTNLLLAEYHSNIGDYSTAERLYRAAEISYLEINDIQEIGRLHEHLGFLFEKKGDFQKAIDEFTLATVYFNTANNYAQLSANLNNLGDLQLQNGAIAEARTSFLKAIEVTRLHSITTIDQTYAHFNLGRISSQAGDLEKAESQLVNAYQLAFEQQPWHTETFRMAKLLGDFYGKIEQPQRAIALLTAQAEHMPESPNETQLLVYSQLVKFYSATDQWEEALAYSERLNSGQIALATAEDQAGYARQASEIALARKILADREEADAYSAAETRWLWVVVATALVLLAAFGYMYRLKEKHRKKALANATHWPELNKRFQALEDALNVLY
ncbi:MAG TPA: hypothetical protein DCP28_36410 [Cytophagales bacterium]|nr:hypothetical protein [Cytophagales bacterium]